MVNSTPSGIRKYVNFTSNTKGFTVLIFHLHEQLFAETSVGCLLEATSLMFIGILCVLDRASSWYLNKGWPTWWHLLYYILLNMFRMLIHPSSGACDYLLRCIGWLEACWCYVAGLSVGDVVSGCRLNHYSLHSDTTSPTDNPGT